MEAVFWSTEIIFFDKSFILASENGFLVNHKPFALIQSLSLLVDTIIEIKCRPSFKQKHYSCSLKPFSLISADILTSDIIFLDSYGWKQLSPASGNGVSIKSFVTTSVYGFLFNFKPCAFLFFLCCWKALLKLGVKQFSSIFQFLTVDTSFSS